MGLLDILNGMQNGPRGPSAPSDPNAKGGMSPMTMAILALLAYKAVKHYGGSQPGSSPAAPASSKIEGSCESESWPDLSVRSNPSKLVTRKPLRLISSITRGRASSDTRRPASARTPPTKQPMLPAPATMMGLVAIMLASHEVLQIR